MVFKLLKPSVSQRTFGFQKGLFMLSLYVIVLYIIIAMGNEHANQDINS
ncbi:MAG: hypothetical protein ACD_21C00011G0012 [uncultured bacterium]|nr:MAG: hypothetical protein ACD_21C00011G0012 [uncultured bacterium]